MNDQTRERVLQTIEHWLGDDSAIAYTYQEWAGGLVQGSAHFESFRAGWLARDGATPTALSDGGSW